MAKPRFTLYKHIKIGATWRYFRAAVATNNKVKPHVVIVGGEEQEHTGGSYCVRHGGQWIDVGNDAAEALRQRTKLVEADSVEEVPVAPATKGTQLAEALKTYLSDLEALGRTNDTLTTYRRDITPFVQNCQAACIEDVTRQDLLDYMRWQRKQPLPKRKRSNPERTYHNRLINVRSFLNAFGVTKLFRKGEYRKQNHDKKVVCASRNRALSAVFACGCRGLVFARLLHRLHGT